ncbi:MAG: Uma2 family endonuclease [Pseudomonadota bacterium]|nr:Uma2 family endonuclease [Pseudomonadota bacterium]
MSVALKRPSARIDLDEFLAWDSGDHSGRRWHLVDGEPAAMAPAADKHGSIQAELARLLGNWLLETGSLYRVVTEPGIVPRIRSSENWRIPDVAVTCAPPNGSVQVPAPVLIVGILSPNNYAETRANVWAYTTIPSVQEVLVVNSVRMEAELLRRDADGSWPEQPEMLLEVATLELASVNFAVPLAALYRTTSLAG